MMRSGHIKFFLKVFLSLIATGILIYNFHIGKTTLYDAYGDATEYISIGVSLAKVQKYGHLDLSKEGGLIEAFQKDKIADESFPFHGHSTWRPPVWPFFIAAVFGLFGYELIYLLIFKYLLHLLGIYLFYRSLQLLNFQKILIYFGTFLYAVSPVWQLYSRVLLSEPITFFLVTAWTYLLIRFLKEKSGFLPQAIIAGLIVLSHPYYIFLPFCVWLIILLKKKMSRKTFLFSSAICAVIISFWIIRNSVVLNTSQLVLTTSSGAVMAKGWNRDVPHKHTNTRGDLANEGLVLQGYDGRPPNSLNEVERMQQYKNATLHFIRSNSHLVPEILAVKLKSAFNPFPETPKPGVLETGRWLFHFLALLSLIYILIFSRNKIVQSLAIGLILSTIGITILTYSGFRFRAPQASLELLLILGFIHELYNRAKARPTT